MIRLSLLLFVAGCGGGGSNEPEPLALGGCLEPALGWPEPTTGSTGTPTYTGYGGRSALIEATILESGEGAHPEGGCGDNSWESWVGNADPVEPRWWTLEEADGTRWFAVASVVDGPGPDLVGEVVTAEFSEHPGGFSPGEGHFVLWTSESWRIWVGDAGGPDALFTPEDLGVAKGAVIDTNRDDCGEWDSFGTRVTWANKTETLDVGETADVGDASITIGNHALSSGSNNCMDWFVAELLISGWR